MKPEQAILKLRAELQRLQFSAPVSHVYNPLDYAWQAHQQYLRKFAGRAPEVVLLGMNPGPWGMVQTGVPFGDVGIVSGWLGISAEIKPPDLLHPKRPVLGFSCSRSEISGSRLWGWARATFVNPERFFERFFVLNYCPLCFFEADGKNRTPDKLPAHEREPLFAACDAAARAVIEGMNPKLVVGIGRFAEGRARAALEGLSVEIACATHPSGANPRASRDWGGQMNATLRAHGVKI